MIDVNLAFYRALESNDLVLMSEVWENSDRVACTHPGRIRLDGIDGVIESFRRIFEFAPAPQILISEVSVVVERRVAWVSLVENFLFPVTGAASALNIFTFDSKRGWQMVLHQAAPILVSSRSE